jgi:preprotein translocase subunit SecA
VLISTSEKTEDYEINEVKDWNKHKDKEIQQVIDNYKKIKKNYESSSIKKNTTKETFKALPTDFFTSCSDDEAYNYIFKAIELTKEYEPRSIQLIASLLLIEKNTKMNRILQILTGEGKTIIISIIAAFLVHKKSKVDIITSSEVLANQSYNETVEFFELLKITVGSNCDQKADIRTRKPKKEIYTYDVVYGTSHSFEADILSDEYEKTGIRNGREFDSVIVDEIDNMFIDNHSGQTLLSSKTPFFERLNFIFYYIWNMIKDWTDVSKITDHTKKTLEEMLLALINNSDGDKESLSENYLPAYLKTLVKKEAKLWIDNAIKSKFYLKEGVDYVLNKTKSNILPVDSSNTGVVQTNSHYSDGIHQFLLIKHDLEMIPFSLTTNFSSNVGLFKRYGKQNKTLCQQEKLADLADGALHGRLGSGPHLVGR